MGMRSRRSFRVCPVVSLFFGHLWPMSLGSHQQQMLGFSIILDARSVHVGSHGLALERRAFREGAPAMIWRASVQAELLGVENVLVHAPQQLRAPSRGQAANLG